MDDRKREPALIVFDEFSAFGRTDWDYILNRMKTGTYIMPWDTGRIFSPDRPADRIKYFEHPRKGTRKAQRLKARGY